MNQILLNSPSQIHKSERSGVQAFRRSGVQAFRRSGVQAFKFKLFVILSFMVLCTNFAKGQNYYLYDPSIPGGAFNSFIQNNPFPTSTSTACSLEVGKSFLFQPTRSIFYGGNLGVAQDISNYGDYLGKWSFTGSWRKQGLYSTSSTVNRLDFLVNYHRWGNYAAHFGLRAESTSDVGNTDIPSARKDAVISWASEFGVTANRLIFQSIEGVDYAGSGSTTNDIDHEWATILSNGNIGSGTSAPTAQFQIKPLSTPGTPLMEVLDGSSNPMFTFVEGSIGGVFNTVGQHSVTSPTGVTSSTYKPFRVIDKTGTGYEIFSILDNGSTTIRSNAAASGTDKILTLKNHSGSDVFFANDNGNINVSNGHLFLPAISGSGIPTTTSYYNILAINSSGQVVSGPAPTANTLWEMGGNALSTTGIIGSKSNYDVDFKVGTSLTLAYKVHGVSSSLRGYTEFNNPISVGVSPSTNWTLNLKSAGTTAGINGVLNCVNNAGTATILKLDDGGNMYLPGIAPATGQSFLGIDASGQLSSMVSSNGYWASSGNTFAGSAGATYSFGTTSHTTGTVYPDDKIEFFAGGNKVFDIWNNIPSTQTEEGSANFCRNVSIQGGTTNTGFSNGNGGLSSTSNCNDEKFSLNIQTALSAGQPTYNTEGILRCVDGSSNNVMTVGASSIGFFTSTTFTSNSSQELIKLMRPGSMLSNILTVKGTTKVYNSILPDRTVISGLTYPSPFYIDLGSTSDKFDHLYTTNIDATNIDAIDIDATDIEATNDLKGKYAHVQTLIPVGGIMTTIGQAGTPPIPFEQIWGKYIYANDLLPMNYTGVPLTSNIGASTLPFSNIYAANIHGGAFHPTVSGTSDIGTGTSDLFDHIWGNNIHVDQLLPINGGISSPTSDIGASNDWFDNIYGVDFYESAAWFASDGRLKENIVPIGGTLSKIKKLNPVKYNFISKPDQEEFGFIAQEIELILPNTVQKPKKPSDNYYLAYIQLIPILTKGIQEQQVIIDSLKRKLDLVFASNQIKDFKSNTSQKEVLNQIPLLFQNHPNPFNGITFIDYFLPDNTTNAFLKVIDNNGKLVKAFPINKTGFGQVELDCSSLAQGTYYYTLLVNNQTVGTRNMIISKSNEY